MKSQETNKLKAWLGSGSINIFGYPFAGKDTLANNLAKVLDAPVISGGDILRSHPDQNKIKELMQTGELFPTDFYLSVIIPYLAKSEFRNKPIILSSVGRWNGEEPAIVQACQDSGHPIRAVIHLQVDESFIWQRFGASQTQKDRAHRHDDARHILEVRLREYQGKTLPVIEFYRRHGLLIEMNGHKEIANTAQDALQKLYDFSTMQTS